MHHQIQKSFAAFFKGEAPTYALEQRDAIHGDIHIWDDYFRIEVGRYLGDVEGIRRLKATAVQTLVDTFDSWRQVSQHVR